MPLPTPEPGLVICYAYLWKAEQNRGQEEGTKDRPCAIILAATREDDDLLVTVVPVTHSQPQNAEDAIELPPRTKLRLGVDAERSWIVASEVNRFVWPGPDLRPVSRAQPDRFEYGVLPPDLFRQVKDRVLTCARAQRLSRVVRGP